VSVRRYEQARSDAALLTNNATVLEALRPGGDIGFQSEGTKTNAKEVM
jgi:hypothetical protein